MKLSIQWLNDFIDLSSLSNEELADLLTMKTCEVEKIESFLPHLKQILVAKVESVEKHLNADKLVVCKVNNGGEVIQIVTGAPNVKAGKKYPLAAIGITLPNGMTMKKAKLRGLESYGMLCSESELGIEEFIFSDEFESKADGLLGLPDDFEVGSSLSEALKIDDTLLNIDNKSITHRPDLWSHFGFAREIASLTGLTLKLNPLESDFKISQDVDSKLGKVNIKIEKDAAISYCGALMSGLELRPSSLQMQARLLSVGMRPINNVVDASNYVMLELGQPNHAFDRSQLNDEIIIDFSKNEEKITTLDSKEHTLPEGIVLIRDKNKPVALGGVMGGENTEVSNTTTDLFLESATFHRHHIRRAVSKLGLRTEASQRFEKGQDPTNAKATILRFAELISKSCPNTQLGSINETTTEPTRENVIETSVSYLLQRLGSAKITGEQIHDILTKLNIKCQIEDDKLVAEVPSYRSYHDLTMADDLVEEVGRVIGYKEIEPGPIKMNIEVPQYLNKKRALEHKMRHLFVNRYQFIESYNYAFHSNNDIALDKRYSEDAEQLLNPIHQDLPNLRISPLVGLLKSLKENTKEENNIGFFETERIFIPSDGPSDGEELPEEKYFFASAFVSSSNDSESLAKLASIVRDLLEKLNLPIAQQVYSEYADHGDVFHPGRAGLASSRSNALIRWGQVSPKITDEMGLPNAYYLETFLDDLLEIEAKQSYYQPVTKYPASDFEVTLLMNATDRFADLQPSIGAIETKVDAGRDKTYIESIDYLGTYTGEQIESGKKAVSLKITWRNASRTLEGDEIKALQDKLLKKLSKVGYEMRS